MTNGVDFDPIDDRKDQKKGVSENRIESNE